LRLEPHLPAFPNLPKTLAFTARHVNNEMRIILILLHGARDDRGLLPLFLETLA